jgi:hypothetical protein
MKFLNFPLFILTIACLFGCGVSYIPLTTNRPPEINFNDSTVHILVINRFDVNKVDFTLRKEKKKAVFNNGINAEIAQVLTELESIKGIQLIKKSDSLTMARNIKADLDSTVLTVGEIQQLAAKYNADYILALEDYDAGFVQDEVVKTKNSDGSTSKIAKYSLAIRSSWVLYDHLGLSFKELRGDVAKYHSERGVVSAILAVGPALGSNVKFVQDVSMLAGKNVAGYFKNQLISLNRPIYTAKLFKESTAAIKIGDYDAANKALILLAKSTDPNVAYKAYYNLAVLAELKGNNRTAIDFAKISNEKKKNMYASMLLNSLQYN